MEAEVAAAIQTFFGQFPLRSYPKGHILIFAGENPSHLFHLVKGKVRKYDVSYRGDEMIVNVFKPPAFFPMSWALNHSPNRYYYKTEAPSEAPSAPVDETVAFLRAHPDVTLDLLGRVYTGLEGLLGRIVHLMSGSARSRILYELVIECRRFGRMSGDGSCRIDLASRAGLSRETVSREVGKLSQAGVLKVSRGGMLVHDIARTERLLGGSV